MKKMDRRNFLKTAGITTVMGAASPTLLSAKYGAVDSEKIISALPPLKTDVVVVGAGPSGVPAAIAAAREGAKVILLEEDLMPGGAPVDMYVGMLCGAPRVGIYREMIQRLNNQYTTQGKPVADFGDAGLTGRDHWYMPGSYVQVITQMIREQPNIELICGAKVTNVIVVAQGNKNLIKGVVIDRHGVQQTIKAAVAIDATGTGLIGDLAGAPVMYGRDGRGTFNEPFGTEIPDMQTQPCTWQYISQRIRPGALIPRQKMTYKGMVEDNFGWVNKEEAIARGTGLYLHWGGHFYCKDTRDPVELAFSQAEAFETLKGDWKLLHDAGYLVHLAPRLGVREIRRIKGEYVITANDIQKGTFAEDSIAVCHYGFDVQGEKISKEERATSKPYGIPYRSLLPLKVDGLLIAGRSISGSHLAMGSYRVQCVVASIGQAAGTAAAMAAINKTIPRNIDVKKLVKKVHDAGLFTEADARKGV